MKTPEHILKQFWGYDTFRENQLQIITNVLAKNDTLVLMPTGGGKSMCYQIPALIKEGICIVVSPLVALMEDQVNQLTEKGIKALAITSGLAFSELDTLLDNCIYGNYKFLYLSPERLQQELVQERIQKMNVSLLAIDEAHCISQWGHDFRPAYLNVKDLRNLQPNVPVIAVTATATPKVQKDIKKHLQFGNVKVFRSSYLRDNLSYGVYQTQDKKYFLSQIVKKQKGSTIVYVPTRNMTLEVVDYLQTLQITCAAYHGGLNKETKNSNFKQWKNNNIQVMVATSAFGMGVDKADVRTVVHLHIPQSIESYFQEAGRAGRDGKQAYALLIQTKNTIQKLKNQYQSQTPDINFIKFVYRKLSSYLQIGYGEGSDKTHQLLFSEFCERYSLSKSKVYAALKILDKNGVLRFTEVYSKVTRLQLIVSSTSFLHLIDTQANYQKIGSAIARLYSGVFTEATIIDIEKLAEEASVSKNMVIEQLTKLNEQEVLVFENNDYDISITYLQPREDDIAINGVSKYIKAHLKNKQAKLNSVVDFVENNSDCKSRQLLNYFGESSTDCGICSVCIKKNKSKQGEDIKIQEAILNQLKIRATDSRSILKVLAYAEEDVIRILRSLLEQRKISIASDNTYKLV